MTTSEAHNKFNLWDALTPAFLIQKFSLIFPLKREGNQIVRSRAAACYTIIFISSYYASVTCAVYFLVIDYKTRKLKIGDPLLKEADFSKSYLIVVIAIFELIFNNIGIFVLLVFSLIKRDKHCLFLQKLYDVDSVFLNQLRANIGYKRLRFTNCLAMLTIFSYYMILLWLALYQLYKFQLLSILTSLVTWLYQGEQGITACASWSYINYVMLLNMRFRMIRQQQEEMAEEKKLRMKSSVQPMDDVSKLSTLIMIYKELCSCIDVLNDMHGSTLIVRITHDFTLTTSQVYLMSWIIMDNPDSDKYELVIVILVWMFQNVMKMGLTTLLTEITIEEAKSCSYTLNKWNKSSDDEDIRCMLDSFDMWLLHRRIEFSANNFFRIDLSLLYAVIGALTSYVLILIQFKQQEETLTGDTSELANQTKSN